MALPEINSTATAFLAGLVTSLHCAGMCGPLACLLMPAGKDRSDPSTVSALYHGGRLLSYSLLGALAGGAGALASVMIRNEVLRYLPWLMVLFFIGMAFQWERHLPKLPLLGGFSLKLQSWLKGRPRTQAGLILGLATPLLPCGPLYFAIAASMLAGSSLRGLEFMLCFCLGTIPLLWLAQAQFQWLHSRLTPRSMGRLRLGLALCSALLIAWRLRSTLGFDGPGLENFICCFG